MAKNYTFQW